MDNSDRQLPNSLDAERAILGAVLLDNSCWFQTDKLTVEDFFIDGHRRIYRAMCELVDRGSPIDFVTITETLKDELNQVGGVAYVTSLTDGLPRVRNIEQYVQIVKEISQGRMFIQVTTQALQKAYEREPIADLIQQADIQLLQIQGSQKTDPKKLCDILAEADEQIEEELKVPEGKEAVGYRTGLSVLDKFTTGYRKREVTVIAGESSDGKSSLMKQGILAQAVGGVKTLVFSREVSRQRLTLDLKTFMSGVFASHVRDPRGMNLVERQKFQEINKMIRDWPVWIDDSRDLHVDDLVHKARKLIRLEGVQIVFIDYAQLIRGNGKSPTEKMEDVCEGVWGLADGENIPVVVLSQLNRDEERKGKQRPRLRRLKQASRIEQDAHCLIFVYQPENEKGERIPDKAELIVAKQRHGPTGIIPVEFDRDELIFKERT